MSAHGWLCFHCGEAFPQTVEGRAEARAHFGPTPDFDAACIEQRTTTHAQAIENLRHVRWTARQSLDNAIALEEQLDLANERIAAGDRKVAEAESQIHELLWIRQRLQDAEAFSRAVHRMRPACWQVAMVEVCGEGTYYPPADSRKNQAVIG